MTDAIVYASAIPQATDVLGPQRGIMKAIGWLLQSTMGTSTGVVGLACTPTAPASLTVNVGPGGIWSLEEIDTTAYGSLAADASPLMKMGINAESAGNNFTLTAPTTSGQSINYLIEASFLEQDGTPVVLPYVNPASPSTPYSGPSNSGTAQNTMRVQSVDLQVLAGAPANTGTQTTPATTSGWVPLYVITVNYGQTEITASGIAVASGAPFLEATLPTAAWGAALYEDTGTTNALAITLAPAPASLADLTGVSLKIKIANTTTGAFTINPNGLGATPVVDQAGNAFTSVTGLGAALADDVATFIYNGTSFVYHPTAGRLINTQTFETVGTTTYTPTPGMRFVRFRLQTPGGGGGGAQVASGNYAAVGSGGGGGVYAEGILTAAQIGASQPITLGAYGVGGTPSDNPTAGGSCSIGSLVSQPGGSAGGMGISTYYSANGNGGGAGGGTTAGNSTNCLVVRDGQYGGRSQSVWISGSAVWVLAGSGAPSMFSGGAQEVGTTSGTATNGNSAPNYGGGGGGGAANNDASGATGGNGAPGILIIEEYA